MGMTPDPLLRVTDKPAEPSRSIVEALTEVVADASGLVRAEAQLARIETVDNAAKAGAAVVRIGIGAVFLVLALTFATVAMVVALASMIGLLWALLAVAGGSVLVGILLVATGRGALSGVSLMPRKSMARISADIDSLTSRAESIRQRSADPGNDV
jgi:hypothetical protein